MTLSQLAVDEPLSPELVLVLPPELRAEVLAALPDHPARPVPRRLGVAPTPAVAEPARPSVVAMLAMRVLTLGTIFVGVTLVTLALALVAQATR